jgi:hypothetical protein
MTGRHDTLVSKWRASAIDVEPDPCDYIVVNWKVSLTAITRANPGAFGSRPEPLLP